MWAVTPYTSRPLNSTYTCSVTLLPTFLALQNFWVHVCTTNNNNIATHIEASVYEALGLYSTLSISNVELHYRYV